MEHDIPFGNFNRENGTTFLDFPLFLGIFQWDEPTKRVPFTAEPEIPEILTKWKAPEVWETNAEIPYWWRVTTQVWIVLLIGWRFALLTNQKNYPDLGSVAPSVWNFCTCFSDINFTGKAAVVWRNVGRFLRSLSLPLFSPALRHVPSVPFQLLNLRFTSIAN